MNSPACQDFRLKTGLPHDQVVAAAEAAHGRDHEDTAGALHNLAGNLERSGKAREAESLFREALAIYLAKARLGEGG